MKSLWLAFHPENTLHPDIWSHVIVPIYLTSNFKEIQSLLNNEFKNHKRIAAIDADLQADRIILVKIAELMGFDAIELDEQLERNTLTVEQYNELKIYTSLKIGLTSCPDPILHFVFDNGVVPDFICITAYSSDYVNALECVVDKVHPIPVIGVINIADASISESVLANNILTAYKKCDGLWIWGYFADNPQMRETARKNYPIVEQLMIKYILLNRNL